MPISPSVEHVYILITLRETIKHKQHTVDVFIVLNPRQCSLTKVPLAALKCIKHTDFQEIEALHCKTEVLQSQTAGVQQCSDTCII